MNKRPTLNFLGKPAPPGYVAGVGRGATGFTTRSDVGPAREAAIASTSRPSTSKRQAEDDAEDEDVYLNETNYDEFTGYGGSLFSKRDPYDEDDQEADRIYDAIDKHLDERGKAIREAKARQQLEEYRQKRPKIQQQFSDLKSALSQLSEDEWMNIPEVGDARNRKQRISRQDKFTPVPDSLLAHQAKLASGGERLVYIDPKQTDHLLGKIDEDDEGKGLDDKVSEIEEKKQIAERLEKQQSLSIDEMSDCRGSYMSWKLSRRTAEGDLMTSSSAASAQDYLMNLQTSVDNQITDEATLTEYRKQFAALRFSNPNFANAWIASVRLEEAAGKLKTARALILEACEKNPKKPDLWCEAARLHPGDTARPLMVKALKENPRSIRLWLKAAELETNDESRRRVFAKARQVAPKSEILWKKSVELEQPDVARLILRDAVEHCPESVELWIALARLENYEEAKKVLAKASQKNPRDRSVWITAAKLEESAGNRSLVEVIISGAINHLAKHGTEVRREAWLAEAVDAERAGCRVTCEEIIKRVISWNLGDMSVDERLKLWLDEASEFAGRKSFECARSIYMAIIGESNLGKSEKVWRSFADFERKHGTHEQVLAVLRRSVSSQHCPNNEDLWLELAGEQASGNHLRAARKTLVEALEANPSSERIVLAAVELECNNNNHKFARKLLADACMSARTPQLVARAARLEWSLGNLDETIRMLKSGLEQYRQVGELYLMLGQVEEQRDNMEAAKLHYSEGLKFCPKQVDLWIGLAKIEERTGFLARARSKLEMARMRNPKVPKLWLEAARLEWRALEAKQGAAKPITTGARVDIPRTILTKGIRECRGLDGVRQLEEELIELNSKRKFQLGKILRSND